MRFLERSMITGTLALLTACAASPRVPEPAVTNILFVCEHGNVKSLMAASYFNEMAKERGLPFRGVSRGSAPDSTTVPPAIASALRAEGFDVRAFHPAAVDAADVIASRRVITIGTALPASVDTAGADIEQWSDVPPASTDYSASSDSLRKHVRDLVDRLASPAPD